VPMKSYSKVCPWCNTSLSLGESGTRLAKDAPKWYTFQFSGCSTRYVEVCPYCASPIKMVIRKLWLTLTIPFALCFITVLFLTGSYELPAWAMPLTGVLFVAGMVLAMLTGRVERCVE